MSKIKDYTESQKRFADQELGADEPVCDFCNGTGDVREDERDENGNWMHGVTVKKCICQYNQS